MRLHVVLLRLFLLITTINHPAIAQTDAELRVLYGRKDFVRMEIIARRGDTRAEAWMGLMLQNADRRAEAKVWWKLAAEKGDRWSILMLAEMHYLDHEDELAVQWYRRGAEAGYPAAQNTLASMLLIGRGAAKDEGEAARWYAAAVAQRDPDAYLPLAQLYASGLGVARDPVEAYALATISEVVGRYSEDRVNALKAEIAKQLTPPQMIAAQARINMLRPDFDELQALRDGEDTAQWIALFLMVAILLAALSIFFFAVRYLLTMANRLLRRLG
jgi:hypothetical protein